MVGRTRWAAVWDGDIASWRSEAPVGLEGSWKMDTGPGGCLPRTPKGLDHHRQACTLDPVLPLRPATQPFPQSSELTSLATGGAKIPQDVYRGNLNGRCSLFLAHEYSLQRQLGSGKETGKHRQSPANTGDAPSEERTPKQTRA